MPDITISPVPSKMLSAFDNPAEVDWLTTTIR